MEKVAEAKKRERIERKTETGVQDHQVLQSWRCGDPLSIQRQHGQIPNIVCSCFQKWHAQLAMWDSFTLLPQISIFTPGKLRQVPFISEVGTRRTFRRKNVTEVEFENVANMSVWPPKRISRLWGYKHTDTFTVVSVMNWNLTINWTPYICSLKIYCIQSHMFTSNQAHFTHLTSSLELSMVAAPWCG